MTITRIIRAATGICVSSMLLSGCTYGLQHIQKGQESDAEWEESYYKQAAPPATTTPAAEKGPEAPVSKEDSKEDSVETPVEDSPES